MQFFACFTGQVRLPFAPSPHKWGDLELNQKKYVCLKSANTTNFSLQEKIPEVRIELTRTLRPKVPKTFVAPVTPLGLKNYGAEGGDRTHECLFCRQMC